jgi:hypothetical protein
MLTYARARELLLTAKDMANGKPIANNTRLHDRGGYIAVRLHNTDIVDIYPDGKYVLHTGGWQTVTTKDRINSYAPVHIYQRKHVWYMADRNGNQIEFHDGMTIRLPG